MESVRQLNAVNTTDGIAYLNTDGGSAEDDRDESLETRKRTVGNVLAYGSGRRRKWWLARSIFTDLRCAKE